MSEQRHAVPQSLAYMPDILQALQIVGLSMAQLRSHMDHSTATDSATHVADLIAAQLALLAMPS